MIKPRSYSHNNPRQSAAQLARGLAEGFIDPTSLSKAQVLKLAEHITKHDAGWRGRQLQARQAALDLKHSKIHVARALRAEELAKQWETDARYWRKRFDACTRVRLGARLADEPDA